VERGDHGDGDADPAGAARDGRREHQRARQVAVVGPVVLEQADGHEAEPLPPLDHLQGGGVAIGHLDAGELGVAEVKSQDTQRHGRLP
jgi:hypothetical protein